MIKRNGVTLIEIMIVGVFILTIGSMALGMFGFFSGSWRNNWNDSWRNWGGKQRYKLTLWVTDKVVKEEVLETYIDPTENGSGLRYYKNNKLIMVNGTYYLEEL